MHAWILPSPPFVLSFWCSLTELHCRASPELQDNLLFLFHARMAFEDLFALVCYSFGIHTDSPAPHPDLTSLVESPGRNPHCTVVESRSSPWSLCFLGHQLCVCPSLSFPTPRRVIPSSIHSGARKLTLWTIRHARFPERNGRGQIA